MRTNYDLEGAKVLVCENCGMLGCSSNGQKWWGATISQEMWPYSSKLEKHSFSNGVCKGCGNSKGATSTTVTFAAGEATLKVGEKFSLSPKVTPSSAAKKLKLKSTNSKIAKVNTKGVVTAVKAGTTTIKGTIDGKTLATCKVTVEQGNEGKDLFAYLGMKLKTAARKLGFTDYERVEGSDFVGYERDDVSIAGLCHLYYDTAILNCVEIKASSKYNIVGVTWGMAIDKANDTVLSKGWKKMNYSSVYSYYSYTKGEYGMTIRYKGDYVTHIVVSTTSY